MPNQKPFGDQIGRFLPQVDYNILKCDVSGVCASRLIFNNHRILEAVHTPPYPWNAASHECINILTR